MRGPFPRSRKYEPKGEKAAPDTLTETQRRRLPMKMEGLSEREIAGTEGKRLMAIRDSLEQVGKKQVALRKKFLKKHSSK